MKWNKTNTKEIQWEKFDRKMYLQTEQHFFPLPFAKLKKRFSNLTECQLDER